MANFFGDLEKLPPPAEPECNILPNSACGYVLRDTFTVVLAVWSALQLIWVTMLSITQLFLIARAQTTWESMRGNIHNNSRTSELVTSAFTAGSTSIEGAQIAEPSMAPGQTATKSHHQRRKREGCLAQWKKLLGLDSFVATASGKATRRRNPFSRGVITNCKDFWCDPAPYFRTRANGAAMLDGDIVDYTTMYEVPPRIKMKRSRDEDGGVYHSVGSEEVV